MPLAAVLLITSPIRSASPSRYTCTEAARCQPAGMEPAPAHDAFTRLLQRQPADTADLWQEAQQLIPSQGRDLGGGRHHPGQALCAEDRVGDVALEWQASPRGAGHQLGISALDRGHRPGSPAISACMTSPWAARPRTNTCAIW